MAKSNTQLSTINPEEEAKLAMILGGSEQTAEASKP